MTNEIEEKLQESSFPELQQKVTQDDTLLSSENFADPNEPKNLEVTNLTEFLATEFPPRELILSPFLPRAGLCMIHAYRGVGKTHVALEIAYAAVTGGEFLGWKAPKPSGVLYIDGEMPAAALQERLAKIVLGSNDNLLLQKFHLITPDLQKFGMPDISTLEGQTAINQHITDEIDEYSGPSRTPILVLFEQ